MNPPSSSTSSSEPAPARPWRLTLVMLGWIAFALIAIDVAINIVFRYPSDPRVIDPARMALYFDYGRSTEGKLVRMTRADRSQTAPITLTGWYSPLASKDYSPGGDAGTVTIYGMSHSVRLAEALERTSTRYTARSVGAPGATANWAYGAFLRDRGGGKSKAVVLSLMSLNLPMINTMSPMTWNISFPMPYTADRFFVEGDLLAVRRAPYESFEDYVQTAADPVKWNAARAIFKAHDSKYDPFLMERSVLDHSALLRLIRRSYGQSVEREARSGVLDGSGFNPESEEIQVANAIVRDFAKRARANGMIPVIFLVNNFGYSDTLYRALRETIERDSIPHLSSHTVISPTDPRGYLPDSHFTDANDDRLARALEKVIADAERAGPSAQ
jgi:hypothetical protein